MAWNGMFKKFNRKTVTDTYPTTGDGERKLADRNEAVHAENERLRGDVKLLHGRLVQEYDRGYLAGLKRAWNLVDDLEGRPGKRQIADKLRNEIAKAEGQNHG